MSVSESAERLRRQAVADDRRRARAADRQQRQEDLLAAAEQARLTGRPFVLLEITGDPFTDVLPVELADGSRAEVHAGVVEFINPADREYDHRIRIEVESGLVRDGGSIRVADGHRFAFAAEVTTIRRGAGRPVSVSAMQRERVGELIEQAVTILIRYPDGSPTQEDPRQAGRLLEEPLGDDDLMDLARRAHDRAMVTPGLGIRAAIQQDLAAAGQAHSESTAKALDRRAQALGVIPPRGPGRPRRG